jgi:glutathione S-transferase
VTLRLYRAEWSTNVERVLLALAHKGLEAEPMWISYEDRSAVVAVSGQPLVPVLEHDGAVVADSQRILRYLDERWPEAPLWPPDPAAAARVDVFLEWFDGVWKLPPNAIAAAGPSEALSARVRGWLGVFERLLEGGDHLLGLFGAADCVAYPFLKYGLGRDPADDEWFHRVLEQELALGDGFPRLAAWIRRMAGRPGAYAATF